MNRFLLRPVSSLRRATARLINAGHILFSPPQPAPTAKDEAHKDWLKVRGDHTLRLDYSLNSTDVVVDAGGFEGQWASDIFAKYLCQVHIFEPVPAFAAEIRERFARNPSIHLHACALGGKDSELTLSLEADASSAYASPAATQTVKAPVRAFAAVCEDLGLAEIALMKINIEGGEYELLEHIIASGLIHNVRELQIQFHDFIPDAERRMAAIQQSLSATHDQTWAYPFIWENWRRRGISQ